MAQAQEARTIATRDRLVEDHLKLVKAIAVRIREGLPAQVDLDDLISAGVLGLFDAANKFNPDKRVAFSSYAKHRIRGAILDSLRQLDWASRDLRRRQKRVEAATRELAATLERSPTEAELAAELGVDVERFRQIMLDLRSTGLISGSSRPSGQEDLPAPEFRSNPLREPDNVCLAGELSTALLKALSTLPPRYRQVMELYYRDELSMKEIGERLGVNESRISQMHKKALEKLRAVMVESGVTSPRAFGQAA